MFCFYTWYQVAFAFTVIVSALCYHRILGLATATDLEYHTCLPSPRELSWFSRLYASQSTPDSPTLARRSLGAYFEKAVVCASYIPRKFESLVARFRSFYEFSRKMRLGAIFYLCFALFLNLFSLLYTTVIVVAPPVGIIFSVLALVNSASVASWIFVATLLLRWVVFLLYLGWYSRLMVSN